MGLVDNERVSPGPEFADLVEDVGELLQRGDDDSGLLAGECVSELGGALVDLGDHAMGVLELVDGVLELAVEHDTVGDHHDLVEYLHVRLVVQRREPVGQPGDRVRLTRPRRVLHEIALARAVAPGVGLECKHGVPLVKPGKDHERIGLLTLGC